VGAARVRAPGVPSHPGAVGVARVAALIPDLLFGSKVQSALEGAGHEVDLLGSEPEAWDEIGGIDVLVVDLTTDAIDGVALVETLAAGGELHGVRTLGFFAHVEPQVRERALAVGFDQVVPRSRMNREGAALVSALVGADA
jgi:CheY-like chemotaxis protein